jgi:hypothetical protein
MTVTSAQTAGVSATGSGRISGKGHKEGTRAGVSLSLCKHIPHWLNPTGQL